MAENQGQRLNMEIGTRVKVEFDGMNTAVNALFVGMEPPQYLIMRLPTGRGLHDHLYEGKKVVAKYVGSGQVLGFKSEIKAYLYKKGLVVAFLAYPQRVETFELRADRRIDCYLPAELKIGATAHPGFVLDISSGGCRFGFSTLTDMPDIGKDHEAVLTTQLLGLEGGQNIRALTKSMNKAGKTVSIGLMFIEMGDALQQGIDQYVRQVADFLHNGDS